MCAMAAESGDNGLTAAYMIEFVLVKTIEIIKKCENL